VHDTLSSRDQPPLRILMHDLCVGYLNVALPLNGIASQRGFAASAFLIESFIVEVLALFQVHNAVEWQYGIDWT